MNTESRMKFELFHEFPSALMDLAVHRCEGASGRRCGSRRMAEASASRHGLPCSPSLGRRRLPAGHHRSINRLLKKSRRPRRWRFSALGRSLARGDARVHRERRATPAAPKTAPSPTIPEVGDAAKTTGGLRRTLGRAALLRWPYRLLASGRFRSHRGHRDFFSSLLNTTKTLCTTG